MVALLSRIKGYGVDAAVAVDRALRVAETISLISVGVGAHILSQTISMSVNMSTNRRVSMTVSASENLFVMVL